MDVLSTYLKQFRSLNINRQNGGAPHKPVLLLAVIDLYDRGLIQSNRFSFSDLLIDTFHSIWNDLVGKHPHFNPTIIYPVWRMQSEGFWRPQPLAGREFALDSSKNVRSFAHFRETLLHLEIDTELALLFAESTSRMALQRAILEKYFPNHTEEFLSDQADQRYERFFEWQLREPQAPYDITWDQPRKQLKKIEKEEEKYVRDGKFARNVLYAYQRTCCISRLQVQHSSVSLVDACHIVPHAETGDNSIHNALALTPTLHRAFDQHLFTVTEDYRVLMSPRRFTENDASTYRLRQFEGKEILLPKNPDYWPGKAYLKQHNDRFSSLES